MPPTENNGTGRSASGSSLSPPGKPPPESRIGAAAFAAAELWQGRDDPRLARDARGLILPTLDNVVMILRNDPHWRGVVALNEFSGIVVKRKPPPFEVTEIGEWTDTDDARLEYWLARNYGLRRLPESALQRGVMLTADAQRFHEVREYLESVEPKWDRRRRLYCWLHAYLGVPQDVTAAEPDYTSLAGVKFLVGAVARIMRAPHPVKVENVLILEGPQGAGKSSALRILFSPWFTDAAFEIGSTDGYQIMRGMWGVELPELDSFGRAESSRSKGFFSREVDRYRNPYGRKPVNVVRQCVFAGSVNHATYLKDDTGNRRYLPVRVGHIALDELAADKDQIWAEAVHEYRAGTPWWVRASEVALFREAQDERYIGDAYQDRISNWLDSPDAGGSRRMEATTAEILGQALALEVARWTLAEQQRVGRIMARMPGWRRVKRGGREAREWIYVRTKEGEQ